MNSYIVTRYALRSRPVIDHVETVVEAVSAEDAVHKTLRSPFYSSQTKRWQRHSDPIVRDNAHYQIDRLGYSGASAERVETRGREAEIKSEQSAIIEAERAVRRLQRDALTAAGYMA